MPRRSKARRFGEKLRTLRMRRGLTMQELADQLGSNSAYISRVENGQIETRVSFAMEVAEFFQVSTDVLLNDGVELDLT